MKKRYLIFGLIIFILILCIILVVKDINNNINNPQKITIKYYEIGTTNLKNVKNITSKKELRKFIKYTKQIEPLTGLKQIDLTIANEIEIKAGNITINAQKSQKDYVYYVNKDKEISSISKITPEFYDWIIKQVEVKANEK